MSQLLVERLRVLHAITDNLLYAGTLDELCRQAVLLAHTRLGIPRVSIWLAQTDRSCLRGTFGIAEDGSVRDERERRLPDPSWFEQWLGIVVDGDGVALYPDGPLKDDGQREVGRGMRGVAPLWDGYDVLGALCVDDLGSPGAIGPDEVQVLRIYATSLAHLCSLKRAEETLRRGEESQRLLAERLEALQHINNELSKAANEDDLCRRAVTLGHERLGLPRLSIWFLLHPPAFVRGTFGVSETGEVRDERGHEHEARSPLLADVLRHRLRFARADGHDLRDDDGQVVGTGTQIYAALWDGERVIGVLTVDDLGHPGALDGQMDRILPLFAASIGHLCSLKRAEEERHKLERQVLHAQKLESLGVLAGGIAHDFNNLLTGILGNTDLALEDLPPDSPARESLLGIETAARRAADLALQMLAYSGKGTFVVEPTDLTAVVEDMDHLLRAAVPAAVGLRSRLTRDLPTVDSDVSQVRQVVMSLLTNAAEALPESGGTVTIATGVCDCDAAYLTASDGKDDLPAGPYVYLEVADTGCGMGPETLARVYDPFFSTKFTGRGLGLAATLGIVRGHRGAIKIDSAPGAGTTVRVLLPLSGSAARAEPSRRPPPPRRRSGTVLLVDDEETVRAAGSMMLEFLGFDTLTANDGLEAVEILREYSEKIACVILDLTMPNMNGPEAFAELRRLRPDLPVIFSSGYGELDMDNRLPSQGVAGFIQKPYSSAELAGALDKALAGRAEDRAE